MLVPPSYVFVPARLSVPTPVFVSEKLPAASLITPVRAKVVELAVSSVVSAARVMAPESVFEPPVFLIAVPEEPS